MLIIHENELIHTDDFNDVIEHFGIKGMKWGHRRAANNGVPRIGQFSGRIKKNLVARKNMKRANEKKIAALGKNDPKRRELINKNKDLTNMNKKAELRLSRNKRNKKIVGGVLGAATTAALQYQLIKATDPQKAAYAKEGVKMAGKAAKYGAKYGAKHAGEAVKKAYNVSKYAVGGVAKRKYL